MDEQDTSRGTQGGVHGSFRTPDRISGEKPAGASDVSPRATAAATPARPTNPIRRRLPPVPDWVWNLARWTAIAGLAIGAGGGALLTGGHASGVKKVGFAIVGAIFGGAFGLFVPLALFWISVIAMVAGLALGVIALVVWLVRRAAHH